VSYAPDDFAPAQEVRSELPPFAVAPHWVTFSVSGNAARLYNLYAAHGSGDSMSDRVVWPTLDDLAEMMGLSRGDKVTPYMRELEKAKAIEVEKVRSKDKLRWRYRITVKVTPPEGYDGPLSTADWYARHRPEYADRGAKSSISAGHPQHPENGGSQDPVSGGLQAPAEGVGSKTNINKNNSKNTDAAPSARSAADARRASTGSSARAREGGSAASSGAKAPKKSRRLSSYEAKEIRAIEAAYPSELRALLPKYRPDVVRDAMLDALALGTPYCRTGEELGARVDRRWYTWHLAREADTTTGGKGLKSPVGALVTMLRHTDCPNPRCEDGTVIETGERCKACVQRKAERRAAHRAGRAAGKTVPAARSDKKAEPMWECVDCRAPSRGRASEDGLCRECRTEAAAAAQVVAATRARWAQERDEAERAGWLKLLEEAYAEHERREAERAQVNAVARAQAEHAQTEAEERARLRAQVAEEHPYLLQYSQGPASPSTC